MSITHIFSAEFFFAEELPVFALQDDRIVEIVGEPAGVHKAIELIASHLRKFLVDRSIIPLIEMQVCVLLKVHIESNFYYLNIISGSYYLIISDANAQFSCGTTHASSSALGSPASIFST